MARVSISQKEVTSFVEGVLMGKTADAQIIRRDQEVDYTHHAELRDPEVGVVGWRSLWTAVWSHFAPVAHERRMFKLHDDAKGQSRVMKNLDRMTHKAVCDIGQGARRAVAEAMPTIDLYSLYTGSLYMGVIELAYCATGGMQMSYAVVLRLARYMQARAADTILRRFPEMLDDVIKPAEEAKWLPGYSGQVQRHANNLREDYDTIRALMFDKFGKSYSLPDFITVRDVCSPLARIGGTDMSNLLNDYYRYTVIHTTDKAVLKKQQASSQAQQMPMTSPVITEEADTVGLRPMVTVDVPVSKLSFIIIPKDGEE